MTIFVGIDPGKQGAIAWTWIWPRVDNVVSEATVKPTPLIKATVSGGKKRGKDQYDLTAICEMFTASPIEEIADELFVTVEESRPMPPNVKAGSLAQFNRGVSTGWLWMLTALRIPYQVVSPQNWQKIMLLGTPGEDTKQRSIMAAKRLFPEVSLKRTERSRKDDDGISDALLLAEFGRRTFQWTTDRPDHRRNSETADEFKLRVEGLSPS